MMSMADELPGKPTWELHHNFSASLFDMWQGKILELVINSKCVYFLWWSMIILGIENYDC